MKHIMDALIEMESLCMELGIDNADIVSYVESVVNERLMKLTLLQTQKKTELEILTVEINQNRTVLGLPSVDNHQNTSSQSNLVDRIAVQLAELSKHREHIQSNMRKKQKYIDEIRKLSELLDMPLPSIATSDALSDSLLNELDAEKNRLFEKTSEIREQKLLLQQNIAEMFEYLEGIDAIVDSLVQDEEKRILFQIANLTTLSYSDLRTLETELKQIEQERRLFVEIQNKIIQEQTLFLHAMGISTEMETPDNKVSLSNIYHLTRRANEKDTEITTHKRTVFDKLTIRIQDVNEFIEDMKIDETCENEEIIRIHNIIDQAEQQKNDSVSINKLVDERLDFLKTVEEFEKKSSDPSRLFAPSFQLVQEETFRKNIFPTLQQYESSIVEKLDQYEEKHKQPYKYNNENYRSVLLKFNKQRFAR